MFYKIAENFQVKIDTSKLKDIPTIFQQSTEDRKTRPVWIKHTRFTRAGDWAFVSFLENPYMIYPELCNDIVDKISYLSDNKINKSKEDIRFIRTEGDLIPHHDGTRHSCINIGLELSDSATTTFSINNSFDDYDCIPPNITGFNIKQGEIYILDVKNVHAVHQISTEPRYLATLSFMEPYSYLLNIFNP